MSVFAQLNGVSVAVTDVGLNPGTIVSGTPELGLEPSLTIGGTPGFAKFLPMITIERMPDPSPVQATEVFVMIGAAAFAAPASAIAPTNRKTAARIL